MDPMTRRRALLVFTRSPQAEARAKGFRGESGAPLFLAFLESWVRLARETGTEMVLAAPAACRRRLEASGVGRGAWFLTQPRAPFGERVAAAAGEAFSLGFESLVIVGGDAPAIGAADLRRAFEAIESGAVALGPSTDGGVSLIGLEARDADIGRSLRLRDPRALERLLSEAARRDRGVAIFPARAEVDSTADAVRLRRICGCEPGWAAYRFLLARALRAGRPAPHFEAAPAAAPRARRRAPRGPPAA
jgi:glycosyltransferase A (GT-A) superfamily protein (DUF2064 family)